jgi:hypothetical protein
VPGTRAHRAGVVAVCLVMAAVFAGCITDTSSPGSSTVPRGAAAVQGWIFDGTLRPVAGAQVTLGQASAVTDGEGWYQVAAPDRPTVLRVEADGFESVTHFIRLDYPGQRIILNVTLEQRLSMEATVDVLKFNGLITCGAMAQLGHSHDPNRPHEHNDIDCGAEAPDDRTLWRFTIEPTAVGLVVEVVWDADHPYAEWMTLWAYGVAPGQEPELIAYQEMASPLRLQLASQRVQYMAAQGQDLMLDFRVGTGTDITDEAVGLAVMVRQTFEAIASIFHGEPPHPDYTALEDSS